jgi:2-keto-4-pentenoate hydratase/2-oxohepta-3-ene-1,7-dioic acid hydratase in catechol pathway
MRLVSYRPADGGIATGVLAGERVVPIDALIAAQPLPGERTAFLEARSAPAAAGGMLRLLQAGPAAIGQVAAFLDAVVRDRSQERYPALGELRLLAPVPRPGKIVAVGRNYADHAKETGVDPFEKPRIIAKLPSSAIGCGAVVRRPAQVAKMDFEAELAVVIGEFAANVPRARALDFVAGYTALNDLSAREFQFDISPPQTTFAKSMDGFCPMGPWLATRDEIPDPQALELSCFVNGERMQNGHTAEMIFPVDRLIEYVSGFMTLEPGDVIATGTPAGIGAFRKPPVWLVPGDRVRIEISGLGVLENTIA